MHTRTLKKVEIKLTVHKIYMLDSYRIAFIKYVIAFALLYVILCETNQCMFFSDQEQTVTLTWSTFKSLVKSYAKDERKLAELLESKCPSKHLLEVPSKQEPVNILPQLGMWKNSACLGMHACGSKY